MNFTFRARPRNARAAVAALRHEGYVVDQHPRVPWDPFCHFSVYGVRHDEAEALRNLVQRLAPETAWHPGG